MENLGRKWMRKAHSAHFSTKRANVNSKKINFNHLRSKITICCIFIPIIDLMFNSKASGRIFKLAKWLSDSLTLCRREFDPASWNVQKYSDSKVTQLVRSPIKWRCATYKTGPKVCYHFLYLSDSVILRILRKT